ncbi:K+ potassium transporter [Actinacidiphila alni]|uniref:K+ potassium transporter n=2 Tax=Actinacidiphila alni TaxID=380248 RepID=A0A1I2AZQ2_9ACTN|nr:K+ potassium transporter [Actinacidiphila alni]
MWLVATGATVLLVIDLLFVAASLTKLVHGAWLPLLIEEALEQGGLARSITRATDGLEALEHLQDETAELPDIIVLDLNMPRMNGRELLRHIKSDPRLKVVPVVVLTTSNAPEDVDAAYQHHANAYVTKPVNLDDFLKAVQNIDAFFLHTATSPTRRQGE